ncbi:Hypothetical protein SMAX5B_003459 [Xyrichtys novacula]|uniref:Uncharacterized protein n=1 Tax=Xyrichtys novacula TaxID=13765 RepID=A0AAV1GIL8_XYRNO|nr:Hypothetical protein SMAX5B_003459 [Xyrichtys novacula]
MESSPNYPSANIKHLHPGAALIRSFVGGITRVKPSTARSDGNGLLELGRFKGLFATAKCGGPTSREGLETTSLLAPHCVLVKVVQPHCLTKLGSDLGSIKEKFSSNEVHVGACLCVCSFGIRKSLGQSKERAQVRRKEKEKEEERRWKMKSWEMEGSLNAPHLTETEAALWREDRPPLPLTPGVLGCPGKADGSDSCSMGGILCVYFYL